MIIAISGFSGTGKNTLGEKLAQKYNLKHIQFSFKDIAKKENKSLLEVQKEANLDFSYDKKLDEKIINEAKTGNCVITTWLAPWMIKECDLRIWLFAPLDVRVERIAKRDNMTINDAKNHVLARDRDNIERYKRVYSIDITDQSIFDICLNTSLYSPDELFSVVKHLIKVKKIKE